MGRENELYRDKIEVSLDGRQIFSLFFAGAVIVCAVFVIGIIVGKRVEARAHVDRVGGGAAGDPLAALDRLEAEAPLSFRRTLRGGQPASGSVDAEIAAMASAQKAAGGEPTPAGKGGAIASAASGEEAHGDSATDAAKAEVKKAEEAKKADAAKAEAKKAEEAKAEEAKAEAKKAEAKKADAAKEEARKLAKVDEKTEKTEKSEKTEKTDDAKGKKSRYTLQLSSFQERGEAETFLSELRAAGYSAFVVPAEVEGKGTFYRVRLGTYGSYDDAVAAKVEFERKINRIAYVTKI
jgi:DedD protein